MWVATPNTAADQAAAAEAEAPRMVEGMTGEAVRILDEVAWAVAAALGEAVVDDDTAREVVPLVTVPPSACLRVQGRTAARSPW